jgi:hypothetical protein
MLTDREQFPILDDQPAVTGRIRRLEADNDDVVALRQPLPRRLQRSGSDQRCVAEDHQDIVVALFDRRARGKYGMRRPQPFLLQEGGDRHRASARCR